MSCCGSSVVSAHTASSAVFSCDSANFHATETLRSSESITAPPDSEEHLSTTSADNCSESGSFPNEEEGHDLDADDQEGVIVYVKGNPKNEVLKDCAYCQRVMLILEEKQIPYSVHLIDPRYKPEWLMEMHPSCHLPVIQDGDILVTESGKISDFIEDKYPEPALDLDEEGMSAGGGIFGAFRRLILNRHASKDPELHQNLENELKSMNDYLEASGGPFFGGTSFSSADVALLPRLYRMQVALRHFKQWQIPESCPKVQAYLELAYQRPSFQKTACSEEEVIHSWKQHLLLD